MNRNVQLGWQLCRFAIVGLLSAMIHYSVVVELVQVTALHPLLANVVGYLVSFQMSYWGHKLWTFSDSIALNRDAFPKLFLVQLIAFAANESLYALFIGSGLPYNVALILVLAILPIFTFISSKFWVFRNP